MRETATAPSVPSIMAEDIPIPPVTEYTCLYRETTNRVLYYANGKRIGKRLIPRSAVIKGEILATREKKSFAVSSPKKTAPQSPSDPPTTDSDDEKSEDCHGNEDEREKRRQAAQLKALNEQHKRSIDDARKKIEDEAEEKRKTEAHERKQREFRQRQLEYEAERARQEARAAELRRRRIEEMARPTLLSLGIRNRKDWKRWLLINHPDKSLNSVDLELVQHINSLAERSWPKSS